VTLTANVELASIVDEAARRLRYALKAAIDSDETRRRLRLRRVNGGDRVAASVEAATAGESVGGNMTAALALMAKERGDVHASPR
jgi:hypothetical protein